MALQDAEVYVQGLVAHGFAGSSPDGSSEVVIVDQNAGCLWPCDWLELDLLGLTGADGASFGATLVWLRGGEVPGSIVCPPGWKPGAFQSIPTGELKTSYKYVGVEEGVEAYRHRRTGKTIYVGRSNLATSSDPENRYLDLLRELSELEHASGGSEHPAVHRQLLSCHERAEKLVREADSNEPAPFHVRGLSARLLGWWEAAESDFRMVSELRPEFVDGWLELTWAQASLGRLDDAERSARRAVALDSDRPDTLGNLASVLLQRGDTDAALGTVRRALELDPENAINRNILKEIRRRRPWYQRLLGV
jgi:hypothetical protein